MKNSIKSGLGFGITSGIITTLGLMVGLHSGTHSSLAVIGGVLTIAIADAFSDALGIHVSKEFENSTNNQKDVWEATAVTFFAKFFIALLFLVPVLLFSLSLAIKISVFMGITLLAFFSHIIAKERNVKSCHVVSEHVSIAIVVIIIAQYVGSFIRNTFI